MRTLAEIMETPATLEAAADEFVAFDAARTRSKEDMNKGIETEEEFIAIVKKCGNNGSINYKKFCEIGKND